LIRLGRLNSEERRSIMDTTTVIRLVAAILFVIGLVYFIQRRRKSAK
jgi:hypothetical protein